MNLLQSFLLGIIQGLTEFIPVSSTAHLLIAGNLLGIPSDERSFSFSVIIQLGTVVAMLAFFWKDIWQIIKEFLLGILHRKPFESLHARLGWLVVVATIPAGMAGLLLKNIVQSMFADTFLQAGIRLLITAVLLTGVEFLDHRNRHLDSANWLDAFSVGLFQVLAIFPGASRSGTTIAGGMARGFSRPEAARFAFLMSGPILLLAGLYESVNVIRMPGTTEFIPYLAAGFMGAAVVGWLAIKWLISYLGRHSLYIFAAYCAVVGVIVLLFKFS